MQIVVWIQIKKSKRVPKGMQKRIQTAFITAGKCHADTL
jgi:hypothetical protein